MDNIVLICLDTVRKDYFERFAPRLSNLSDSSIDHCKSSSSWTVPSHGSLFTGKSPSTHGVHTGNIDFADLPNNDTIMSDLKEFETHCVSANKFISPEFGIDIHFDNVDPLFPRTRYPDGVPVQTSGNGLKKVFNYIRKSVSNENTMKSVANGALIKLDNLLHGSYFPNPLDYGGRAVSKKAVEIADESHEPFFLYLNFMEAHGGFRHHINLKKSDHQVPNTWCSKSIDIWDINTSENVLPFKNDIENYRALYAANIEYLDRLVSNMITSIQDTTGKQTTFIITSDHGENLGGRVDDGLIEHKSSLSEGVLHVPLEIVGADLETEQRHYSHTSTRELVYNLAHNASLSFDDQPIGAELMGLGFSDPDVENKPYWHRMIRCSYSGNKKITWDSQGNIKKYKLSPVKPNWQKETEVLQTIPAWAEALYDVPISEYKSSVQQSKGNEIKRSARNQLESLGYL